MPAARTPAARMPAARMLRYRVERLLANISRDCREMALVAHEINLATLRPPTPARTKLRAKATCREGFEYAHRVFARHISRREEHVHVVRLNVRGKQAPPLAGSGVAHTLGRKAPLAQRQPARSFLHGIGRRIHTPGIPRRVRRSRGSALAVNIAPLVAGQPLAVARPREMVSENRHGLPPFEPRPPSRDLRAATFEPRPPSRDPRAATPEPRPPSRDLRSRARSRAAKVWRALTCPRAKPAARTPAARTPAARMPAARKSRIALRAARV